MVDFQRFKIGLLISIVLMSGCSLIVDSKLSDKKPGSDAGVDRNVDLNENDRSVDSTLDIGLGEHVIQPDMIGPDMLPHSPCANQATLMQEADYWYFSMIKPTRDYMGGVIGLAYLTSTSGAAAEPYLLNYDSLDTNTGSTTLHPLPWIGIAQPQVECAAAGASGSNCGVDVTVAKETMGVFDIIHFVTKANDNNGAPPYQYYLKHYYRDPGSTTNASEKEIRILSSINSNIENINEVSVVADQEGALYIATTYSYYDNPSTQRTDFSMIKATPTSVNNGIIEYDYKECFTRNADGSSELKLAISDSGQYIAASYVYWDQGQGKNRIFVHRWEADSNQCLKDIPNGEVERHEDAGWSMTAAPLTILDNMDVYFTSSNLYPDPNSPDPQNPNMIDGLGVWRWMPNSMNFFQLEDKMIRYGSLQLHRSFGQHVDEKRIIITYEIDDTTQYGKLFIARGRGQNLEFDVREENLNTNSYIDNIRSIVDLPNPDGADKLHIFYRVPPDGSTPDNKARLDYQCTSVFVP